MADPVTLLAGFILNIDAHLNSIIQAYGILAYAILFIIILLETGLVIAPFLPGDSLLFAAGAIAALGSMNVFALFALLSIAAIAGDTINYWIGHRWGVRLFSGHSRLFRKEYLKKTEGFYRRHGGKVIVIARFIPVIRTFAPFVAGIGRMSYGKFILYNILGGITWTAIFIFGGFFFGNLPVVRENFALAIIAIIAISLVPVVVGAARHRLKGRNRI
ncbi:MAG: DedA family protein [Candidatus Aenigmarchaeota archaeon]|nr:DedA family protein [Candidatus Aenigmarchaeota archaeon]